MKVVAVNADTKQDVEAEMFDKVVYNLHPSFGIKAKQSQLSKLEVQPHTRKLPGLVDPVRGADISPHMNTDSP
jgi:hypothetical protein